MKSLVLYYSYTGNTQKAAERLRQALEAKGQADIKRLLPEDESGNFFKQAARAFFNKRAALSDAGFDVSGYDLICIGTPVWAFAPAPAVNTFFDVCTGLEGKKAICFTTCGSGTGVNRCIDKMKRSLQQKGIKWAFAFNIQQGKVSDADFVDAEIKKALQKISV